MGIGVPYFLLFCAYRPRGPDGLFEKSPGGRLGPAAAMVLLVVLRNDSEVKQADEWRLEMNGQCYESVQR